MHSKALLVAVAALAAGSVQLIGAVAVHAGGVPSDCPVANIGTSLDDTLCGTLGADMMDGGAGNDSMFGLGGNDSITGNIGEDFIEGGSGNDTITGGSSGGDFVAGDEGNDQISVRDAELDDAGQCGSGTDSYDMDLRDVASHGNVLFTVLGGCERVTIGAVNEGPNVVISPHTPKIKDNGKVPVRLSCPDSLAAPCAGTLQLGRSEKSPGVPKAYSLAPGTSHKVTARLSPKDRRKLSQGGKLTAAATSIEQGEFGDKTTGQRLALKRHTKRHT